MKAARRKDRTKF